MPSVWAIADPHLGLGIQKDMNLFGARWVNHVQRMSEQWDQIVSPEDTVILAGDISWAMTLDEALPDLQWLQQRPGKKILGKGNHDYWWPSAQKFRHFLQVHQLDQIDFVYNSAVATTDVIVAGSRGWVLSGDGEDSADGDKIREREKQRLRYSIEQAKRLQQERSDLPLLAFLHYPPLNSRGEASPFTEVLEAEQITLCLYGHLHGRGAKQAFVGTARGVQYLNTAADALDFRPLCLDAYLAS